jgi:hypothetical protein
MSDKNTLAEALEKYNKVFGTYSHDYVKELEKQNEELIKYVIANVKNHLIINNTIIIDRNFLKWEIELLEQIKQKPIEEILKEYE